MRVLIAPDSFGGTLSAPEAAQAIARGWRAVRPDDQLTLQPMSDGGPGFLDVMPGESHLLTVEGPTAEPVEAAWKLHGSTAYVESAQAAGLHLTDLRDPTTTTTYGVGQLVRAAVEQGATTVVLGLGGSATNDGGAGMLAALGIRREAADGSRLDPGGLPLAQAARLSGQPLAVDLVAATDVDNPLLGPDGATYVFGPQKGATAEQLEPLDKALGHWADLLEEHLGTTARDLPGAGAAGGLGFAVLALGGRRAPGVDLVISAAGLTAEGQDLVLTGEGCYDAQSLRGKVVGGIARMAQGAGVPCVVLAGRTEVGDRQRAAHGVDAAYSLVDLVGSERALDAPAEALATLAGGVAREWGV
ncbi:MAG: Glycerate kinase [Frankiales bacterium]|nr:Glycerate kinase [Frankiales bacterium]